MPWFFADANIQVSLPISKRKVIPYNILVFSRFTVLGFVPQRGWHRFAYYSILTALHTKNAN